MKQKTFSTKPGQIKRDWHLVDLDEKILGRSASSIASILIGKNKPYYVPHLDCGDYVVAINAEKIKVSGKKAKDKMYYRHSGYPGGFKKYSFSQMLEKDPKKIIELAVRGMLPKNKLRDPRLRRLKVFEGNEHPYQEKLEKRKNIRKN